MHRRNSPKKAERHALKAATYFPKYSHYINRKSNLSFYPKSDYIKPYDKPIYIFVIQDSFSRFVVHACLRQQETSNFKNIPWWFDVENCFQETFEKYGKPFEIVLDRHIKRRYSECLNDNRRVPNEARV